MNQLAVMALPLTVDNADLKIAFRKIVGDGDVYYLFRLVGFAEEFVQVYVRN